MNKSCGGPAVDGEDLAVDTAAKDKDDTPNLDNIPDFLVKLKPKSNVWPALSIRLFENVSEKIKNFASNFEFEKTKNNLTFLEREGLKWCMEQKKNGILYFGQADKGGATIIMDPEIVHNTISTELNDANKYERLASDPRKSIETDLVNVCTSLVSNGGISQTEKWLLTGWNEDNTGKSSKPCFKSGKPHSYPLYKIHKLSSAEITARVTPPARLVTSMTRDQHLELENG